MSGDFNRDLPVLFSCYAKKTSVSGASYRESLQTSEVITHVFIVRKGKKEFQNGYIIKQGGNGYHVTRVAEYPVNRFMLYLECVEVWHGSEAVYVGGGQAMGLSGF